MFPATMQTGLSDGNGIDATPMVKRMLAMGMALVERAGMTAIMYAEHAAHQEATVNDVVLALRYHCKTFLKDDVQRVEAEVNEMQALLEKSSSESESDQEADSDQETEAHEEAVAPFVPVYSSCTCDVCARINETSKTWDSWAPEDEAEIFLKRMADRIHAPPEN